jgi:hypothetical protein
MKSRPSTEQANVIVDRAVQKKKKKTKKPKTSEAASKGTTSETIITSSSEAQMDPELCISKPHSVSFPHQPETVVLSSNSPNSGDIDKEFATILPEGSSRYGNTPKPEDIAKNLFNRQNNTSNLTFLEDHFRPDTLNNTQSNKSHL